VSDITSTTNRNISIFQRANFKNEFVQFGDTVVACIFNRYVDVAGHWNLAVFLRDCQMVGQILADEHGKKFDVVCYCVLTLYVL
jgi:hypothetical protein